MAKRPFSIEIGPGRSDPPPEPPRLRWPWVAAGLVLLVMLGAGLTWFVRAKPASGPPEPRDARQTSPAAAAATERGSISATGGAPSAAILPAGAPAGLVAADPPTMRVAERPGPGAVRVRALAPGYAAAYLARARKRLRADTNGWQAVAAFPHVLPALQPGLHQIRLEVEGFACSSLIGVSTNEAMVQADSGRTNDVQFALTPLGAVLILSCNVTGALARVSSVEYPVARPLTLPSLEPLQLTVSADGHTSQVVTVDPLEPGQTYRREVRLEPTTPAPVAAVVHGSGQTTVLDLGGGVGLELVWIPPGEFMMGSAAGEPGRSSDETQHRVTITGGFWLGRYEVTQQQWQQVMGVNPSSFVNAGPKSPVENVSWNECQEFIRRLNERVPGGGVRLPAEAEWEYACRAGTASAYAGNVDDMAWHGANARETTHPVGGKAPNAWGLHDMHGNVWEWCSDDWHDSYSGAPSDGARWGDGSGPYRVRRGGAWIVAAPGCRSAKRGWSAPGRSYNYLGLRVARDQAH